MKKWKLLDSKYLAKTHFLKLRSDRCKMANGNIADPYFVVEKDDYAIIAAFTPEGKIVLVEQYRHPVKAIDIELPAGFAEKTDKSLAESARRELLEETGYKVAKIEKLGEFFGSPGLMNNSAHLFIGYNARKVAQQNLDQNEEINIKVVSIKQALEYVKKGKMKDLGSVLCLNLALKKYESKLE